LAQGQFFLRSLLDEDWLAMAETDYYQILEVSKRATDADIKKAYRKAAMKWHPDKNPENLDEANSMFKQVGEAYEVLSDPQKRRLYDQGGKAALSGSGRPRGENFHSQFHDPFSVFEQFFGGRDPFEEMFADRPRGHRRSAPGGFSSFFGSDPFGGFDDFGGGAQFMSTSSTSGGRGFTSTSTSTTSRIVNGKRITVTEKTVRKADGTTETTRTESEGGGGRSGGMLGGDSFFDGFFGNDSRDRRSLINFR